MWKNNQFARSAAAEHYETISNAVDEAMQLQKSKNKDECLNRKQFTKINKISEGLVGLIESVSVKGKVKELLVDALLDSKFLSGSFF